MILQTVCLFFIAFKRPIETKISLLKKPYARLSRSLALFQKAIHHIKMDKTSWTYGKCTFQGDSALLKMVVLIVQIVCLYVWVLRYPITKVNIEVYTMQI